MVTLRNLQLNCDVMKQDAKMPAPLAGVESADLAGRQITMIDQRIDSRQIFLDGREVTILHGQEIYRLRLTAQNKLILTK